jgi:hypothetical protein
MPNGKEKYAIKKTNGSFSIAAFCLLIFFEHCINTLYALAMPERTINNLSAHPRPVLLNNNFSVIPESLSA